MNGGSSAEFYSHPGIVEMFLEYPPNCPQPVNVSVPGMCPTFTGTSKTVTQKKDPVTYQKNLLNQKCPITYQKKTF